MEDEQGYIDFPVLGRILLGGLTTTEVREKMERLLEQDNINPNVNLRLTNFKVTATGEVRFTGSFRNPGECGVATWWAIASLFGWS